MAWEPRMFKSRLNLDQFHRPLELAHDFSDPNEQLVLFGIFLSDLLIYLQVQINELQVLCHTHVNISIVEVLVR